MVSRSAPCVSGHVWACPASRRVATGARSFSFILVHFCRSFTLVRARFCVPSVLSPRLRKQNRCSAERDANDEHGRTQEEDDGRVDDRTPMAKLQVRGERDVSESATGTFASRCVSFERPADLLPDGARRGVRRQGRIRTLYSDTREGERRRNVSLAALLFTLRSVESRCRLPLFRRPSGRRARALINSSRRSSRAARF